MSSTHYTSAGPSRAGAGLEAATPPAGSSSRPPPDAEAISSVSPTNPPWRGYLEVRLDGGVSTRRFLTEASVIIGRVPGVQLLLDHHTVSRRHAEMFCDPFGRWWIRDLNSTNGTLVNEEPVHEKVLQPGDRIAIGDFTLTFYLEPRTDSRLQRATVPLEQDDKPTAIRTLLDFEPPRIAAEHLRTLMEFSRRLLNVEEPDERLDALCALMVKSDFRASLAVALRIKGGVPTLISRPHRPGAAVYGEEQPYISRRVLSKLLETHEPVLAGNLITKHDGGSQSVELTMSRDVMALWVVACPLNYNEDADELDVLYVTLPPDLGSVEWLSLIALAAEVYQQGESAWAARKHAQAHAAIERELEMARQIQRALVPTNLDFKGLDVSVGFEPCKWVGGDYVDVVTMADGRILLAVADVCGKGLQAALISSTVHTMVRATADHKTSVSELMERLNKYLCGWLPEHSFVTMIAVAIDPATGEVECVNAGHPPVIIAGKDGSLRYLQSEINPVLGVALSKMDAQRDALAHGDVLAMYTDGLTELRNSSLDMLGLERLSEGFSELCQRSQGESVSQLARRLNEFLADFRGDRLPEDDSAFILARRQ